MSGRDYPRVAGGCCACGPHAWPPLLTVHVATVFSLHFTTAWLQPVQPAHMVSLTLCSAIPAPLTSVRASFLPSSTSLQACHASARVRSPSTNLSADRSRRHCWPGQPALHSPGETWRRHTGVLRTGKLSRAGPRRQLVAVLRPLAPAGRLCCSPPPFCSTLHPSTSSLHSSLC